MEKQISELLIKKIKEKYNIDLDDIKLEVPPKKDLGDFAFGCFMLSKELKKNPAQIAEELVGYIKEDNLIDDVNSAWPYLNIKVNKSIFTKQFLDLLNKDSIKKEEKGTIVIDYIWTNVWKPLHIGHMCTPNQGQVLINVYKRLWYNVIWDSHIGDWGIIFGKLIRAYTLWWNEEKLKENAIDHLLELYIKATSEAEKHSHLDEEYRNEFKKLSEGDDESIKLWESFTRYSIDAMQSQLSRLNVQPYYNIWESFYEWLWLPKMEGFPDLKYDMKSIVKELIEKKIAIKNEDWSVWVIFDEKLKIPSCILQKRDWTHGYLASDLAAIKYRMDNWNPEKIIYFIDVRQQLHLKQAFLIAKNAWWLSDTELFHAYNWFISLKDWAMSTRTWKIIKLDKLLDESENRARNIILEKRDDLSENELKELSRIIWIWAIKYGYLKKSRETDVIFDWDEFMTFEWNSGPYIQYAYVRWIRILEKCNTNIKQNLENIDFVYNEEIELVKLLLNYDKVLEEVALKNMPHILCSYSYNLTKAFSSFYNNVHILNEEDESKKSLRILLVTKFTQILKESFELLWIEMPEKM